MKLITILIVLFWVSLFTARKKDKGHSECMKEIEYRDSIIRVREDRIDLLEFQMEAWKQCCIKRTKK